MEQIIAHLALKKVWFSFFQIRVTCIQKAFSSSLLREKSVKQRLWLGNMNDYSSVTAKHDWTSTNKTNSLSGTDKKKKKSANLFTNLLDLHNPI